jgi:hypothetical protein
MSDSIVTPEVINAVRRALIALPLINPETISYELQDDYRHLLVSIPIDGLEIVDAASTFGSIGAVLNSIVPSRANDYSWMVVFTRGGRVVDSYFGGDAQYPESGL